MLSKQNKGDYMTMQSKVKIWSSFLLIILAAGLLCACGSPAPEAPPTSDTPPSDTSPVPADKVEVVYFHRAQRCTGCVYAETGTRYTLETYFKDELASGKVTFETLNVEDDKNAAIVNEYDAYTSALFVNTITDGTDHIEEVTDIWFHLGDNEAFVEVVKSKIEQSLKG